MEDSIFTKIIRGEIPCHKVYEDARVLAFLDIHPKQPGHVLVVPKKQIEFVWDLPADDYTHLMAVAQKIGQHIRDVRRPKYVGLMVEGLGVPHAHVHVFPFNSSSEYYTQADMQAQPDHTALAQMAKTLEIRS
jgi:histidine triad (HIT) family protein